MRRSSTTWSKTSFRDPPATFVDIGAAEGYYAVGLAIRSPHTVVHAFEMDGWARRRLRELARLNGVADRVHVRRACTPRALDDLGSTRAFVLSDCEGAEVEIFTPDVARALTDSTVLVELHDDLLGIDVMSVLEPRFAATHRVAEIKRTERDPGRCPELAPLSDADRRLALDEFRGAFMRWAVFKPLAAASGNT